MDIFANTETWLYPGEHVIIGELVPDGYSFISVPGEGAEHRGGGIGILYKSSLELSLAPIGLAPKTFEHACVMGKNRDNRFVIVYRPYPSSTNRLKTSEFLDEFEIFLGDISLLPGKLVLSGDFNIHVNKPEKGSSVELILRKTDITENLLY